jgi:signal peptidase I
MALKNHPSLQAETGGKGFLAYAASAFCPGLGHLFAGYYLRAAVVFPLTLGLAAGFVLSLTNPKFITALPIFFPLFALIQFAQMVDAAYCAKRSDNSMLGDKSIRYIVGVIFFALAYFTQDSGMKNLQNNYIQICGYQVDNMVPAIQTGDYFLNQRKAPYGRWDIVLVTSPDPQYQLITDRIVGLPGDKIEITGDGLLINDKLAPLPDGVDRYLPVDADLNILNGPSPSAGPGCWGNPITLGPGEYYLLGDNSPVASDSRTWPSIDGGTPGAVPHEQILGRVSAILYPTNHWRTFPPTQ